LRPPGVKNEAAFQDDDAVQLTDEQVEAAQAQGCRFIEASEAQVRQFSMQRRVFQIRGKPHLAARADGFYETAGTLMALIAEAMQRREASVSEPAVSEPAAPEPATPEPDEAEPAALPAEAEAEAEEALAPAEEEAVMAEAQTPEPPAQEVSPQPLPPPVAVAAAAPEGLRGSPVMRAMTTITKGYLRGHDVDTAQLSALLSTVHRTLSGLQGSGPGSGYPRRGPG
jgi:hypothetical protein